MRTRFEILSAMPPENFDPVSDADLEALWQLGCAGNLHLPVSDAILHAVAEIRRHRAMVSRLEKWATQLEAKRDQPGDVGSFIADELRNRMRGTREAETAAREKAMNEMTGVTP